MTLAPGEWLVVDSSVAIKWVVTEPGSEQAVRLRGHILMTPDLLFAECANVLCRKLRHSLVTAEEADLAARTLERADITVVSAKRYLARAVSIAAELDHPAYDAIYLAVAEAFGVRLVTADHRLIRKTEQSGHRFRAMLLPLSDISREGYSA